MVDFHSPYLLAIAVDSANPNWTRPYCGIAAHIPTADKVLWEGFSSLVSNPLSPALFQPNTVVFYVFTASVLPYHDLTSCWEIGIKQLRFDE